MIQSLIQSFIHSRFIHSVEGKGIEMIRSDQCNYIRRVSEQVLELIYSGCSETQLKQYVHEHQHILYN